MQALSINTGSSGTTRPERLQHLEKLSIFQSFSHIFQALTGSIPRIYSITPGVPATILEFVIPTDFLPPIATGSIQDQDHQSATDAAPLITITGGMKREFIAPILSDGRLLGHLRSGAIERAEPSDNYEKRSIVEAQKRLLSLCAELIGKSALDMGLTDREDIPQVVEEAAKYINDNRHNAGLQLREVAKKFSVSQSYLTELLKRHYGANYREFINRCRIREASLRLEQNPKERISEIAYGVGFHTLSHFNRAFRKATDMTPSAYRRAANAKHRSPLTPAR